MRRNKLRLDAERLQEVRREYGEEAPLGRAAFLLL
jgi:hypothetical protein